MAKPAKRANFCENSVEAFHFSVTYPLRPPKRKVDARDLIWIQATKLDRFAYHQPFIRVYIPAITYPPPNCTLESTLQIRGGSTTPIAVFQRCADRSSLDKIDASSICRVWFDMTGQNFCNECWWRANGDPNPLLSSFSDTELWYERPIGRGGACSAEEATIYTRL